MHHRDQYANYLNIGDTNQSKSTFYYNNQQNPSKMPIITATKSDEFEFRETIKGNFKRLENEINLS